jgi:hypothetical protein
MRITTTNVGDYDDDEVDVNVILLGRCKSASCVDCMWLGRQLRDMHLIPSDCRSVFDRCSVGAKV